MKGYIIYNTEDLTKNKRFIKFITETLNEYNIDVELVIIDRVELAELENPDFQSPHFQAVFRLALSVEKGSLLKMADRQRIFHRLNSCIVEV